MTDSDYNQMRRAMEKEIARRERQLELWRALALGLLFVVALIAFLHFTHQTETGSGWNL